MKWSAGIVGWVSAKPARVLASCLALIAATGAVDHFTGVLVTLSPFYLVSIAIGTWALGGRIGVLLVLFSYVADLASNLTAGAAKFGAGIVVWNGLARCWVFLFVVWLLSRMRSTARDLAVSADRAERAATDLLEADRLKNTFLNAVSHELRTPLAAILGNARTLESIGDELEPEDRARLLHAIPLSARKLDRLLTDLLDVDRLAHGIRSLNRTEVDLAKLMVDVVEGLDIPPNRPLHIQATNVVASADVAKVERILENLITNALKHSPPESPIWVKVERRDGVPLLTVEDAGPGIAPGDRDAVFEPFRRGQTSTTMGPGLGIGLSLVRAFSELHGGRAWMEPRDGGGSSFRVKLPGPAADEPRSPAAGDHDRADGETTDLVSTGSEPGGGRGAGI